MSEKDMHNPEIGADAPAENISQQPAAPAEKKAKKSPAKDKRKKKKNRVPVQIAVILAVLGLVFGIILGYIVGRNSANDRLAEAQIEIAELTAQQQSEALAAQQPSDKEMEIETALADLSGAGMTGEVSIESVLFNGMLDGADMAEAEPVVVAEFNGGQLMSDEVLREYNEQMTTYLFAGYNEEEIASTLLDEVLRYMVGDKILEGKAKEMGLVDLTAADQERIAAQARADYDEQVKFYESFVFESGMSEAELTAAAQAYLLEMEGVTLETVKADIEEGWWMQKLYDELVKDVTVESGDILDVYNEDLAAQKESFSAHPENFELASMNGDVILYNLQGYRAIRTILLPFEAVENAVAVMDITEVISELDPDADAEEIAEYQAQLDGYYASAAALAQEISDQLSAGADFNAMLDQYGADSGMKDAAIRERGYYVSSDSVIWNRNMIDTAMSLGKPGDISAPVRTGEGICILQYAADVQPGEVDMSLVYDSLSAKTLEEAQYLAYEDQVNTWLDEAGARYYPERMQ